MIRTQDLSTVSRANPSLGRHQVPNGSFFPYFHKAFAGMHLRIPLHEHSMGSIFDLNYPRIKQQRGEKNIGGARIKTRGRWVRRANATSVLCSPPYKKLPRQDVIANVLLTEGGPGDGVADDEYRRKSPSDGVERQHHPALRHEGQDEDDEEVQAWKMLDQWQVTRDAQ